MTCSLDLISLLVHSINIHMLQLKIAFTWKKVPLAYPDLATSVSTQPSWSQELCRPWYCLFLLVTLPFLSLQLVWIFFPQEIKTLDEAFLPIAVLSQRPFASESNFYSETPARAKSGLQWAPSGLQCTVKNRPWWQDQEGSAWVWGQQKWDPTSRYLLPPTPSKVSAGLLRLVQCGSKKEGKET